MLYLPLPFWHKYLKAQSTMSSQPSLGCNPYRPAVTVDAGDPRAPTFKALEPEQQEKLYQRLLEHNKRLLEANLNLRKENEHLSEHVHRLAGYVDQGDREKQIVVTELTRVSRLYHEQSQKLAQAEETTRVSLAKIDALNKEIEQMKSTLAWIARNQRM
jgi:predicted transcriptional regulator